MFNNVKSFLYLCKYIILICNDINMRIVTELKEILYQKGLTLKFVAEKLGKRLGETYTLANLSNKLRNETITYREMKIIAEIIDCSLEITKK